MSREIKYIGMNVHKEAIVIAVLNDGGKLVMESIVETKAEQHSCSLSTACEVNCVSPGKKGRGQRGSTICSSPTCSKCRSAIRVAMPY